jgi:hypothetical protein
MEVIKNEVYKKENYVEVAVENFHDYINNLTFSLQKYVNMFYNTLPELYEETRSDAHRHLKCQEMSSFLYAESESLISMKCKHFIYQSISVIQKKFDKLSTDIMEDEEVRTFGFCEEGYFFFLHELDRIDWKALTDRKYYDKHNHSVTEVCQFEEYKTKNDQQLLYIACTRALHQLDILYYNEISIFLEFVNCNPKFNTSDFECLLNN